MSPDSTHPSATRRAWRAISALGCILGGTAILLAAFGKSKDDQQSYRTEQAVCAIIRYSDETIEKLPANPNAAPDAVVRFRKLRDDMRATGIDCPPVDKP